LTECTRHSLSRRGLSALTVALVVAAFAPASASALELGSDLDGPSQVSVGCSAACVLIQDTIASDPTINVVPATGRITGFSVKGVAGSVALVVFRDSGSGLQQIGGSSSITGNGATQSFTLTPAINVRQNDLLALRLDNGASSVGADNAGPGAGTRLVELSSTSPFAEQSSGNLEMFMSATFQANPPVSNPPASNPPPPANNGSGPAESTPVLPDPLAGLKAGKRPGGRIFGGTSKMSRKGVVKVKIANTNDFTITGKLTLKSGRSRLGANRFGLGANSRRYVRVKLSRKARRKLNRKRKMKVMAVLTFTGPIGKSRTLKKRVTLKAPPRPKRRRGSGGGGGGGGGNVCGTPRFGPGYTDINGDYHPGRLNYCPNLYPDTTF